MNERDGEMNGGEMVVEKGMVQAWAWAWYMEDGGIVSGNEV